MFDLVKEDDKARIESAKKDIEKKKETRRHTSRWTHTTDNTDNKTVKQIEDKTNNRTNKQTDDSKHTVAKTPIKEEPLSSEGSCFNEYRLTYTN